MKKLLPFILLLFTVAHATAQQNFPSAYKGKWKGKLNIHSPGIKQAGELDMELNIQSTDSAGVWKWEIGYITKGKAPDVRKYLLVVADSARGKYSIDEKNGILINARLVANILTCRFAVGSSLLLVNYTLLGDTIEFEIFTGPAEPAAITGNKPEEGIPAVDVYGITEYQKAVLTRAK